MLGIVLGTVGWPSCNQWCSGREDEKCSPNMTKPVSNYSCLLVAIDCSWVFFVSLLSRFCQADFTCASEHLQVPITVLGLFVSAWLQSRAWVIFESLRLWRILAEWNYWCRKMSIDWPLGLWASWSSSLFFCCLMFLYVSVLWFSST